MSALLERLAGRRVIASISGGKDSAAMGLWLLEQGVPFDAVHQRTGWDAERFGFYDYLRGDVARALGVKIVEVEGPLLMADLIRKKGMFPSRVRRFCTEELKIDPMKVFVDRLVDAGEDVVNAVGIRASESLERRDAIEWEWSEKFECEVWRPILSWSLDDVVAIHKRHGLKPNPLYLMGAERVGCWPCINATKAEIRLIADTDPARIDEIRVLEAEVGALAKERYDRDRAAWLASPPPEPQPPGTTQHQRWVKKRDRLMAPFKAPAFFQAKMADADGTYPCWPIDKVVEWSRTSRGGRQFELFAGDPSQAGCMRWGLCETAPPTHPAPLSKEDSER